MKKKFSPLNAAALTFSALLGASSLAVANDLESARTIDMCVEYHDAKTDRKEMLKTEINRRGMISYKDFDTFKTGEIVPGSSVCGMYMFAGKPLAEKAKQIRVMTFKTVHVYPTKYYVSQSGLIMEVLERKEGSVAPTLIHKPPAVMPPPVLYKTPGGSHL